MRRDWWQRSRGLLKAADALDRQRDFALADACVRRAEALIPQNVRMADAPQRKWQDYQDQFPHRQGIQPVPDDIPLIEQGASPEEHADYWRRRWLDPEATAYGLPTYKGSTPFDVDELMPVSQRAVEIARAIQGIANPQDYPKAILAYLGIEPGYQTIYDRQLRKDIQAALSIVANLPLGARVGPSNSTLQREIDDALQRGMAPYLGTKLRDAQKEYLESIGTALSLRDQARDTYGEEADEATLDEIARLYVSDHYDKKHLRGLPLRTLQELSRVLKSPPPEGMSESLWREHVMDAAGTLGERFPEALASLRDPDTGESHLEALQYVPHGPAVRTPVMQEYLARHIRDLAGSGHMLSPDRYRGGSDAEDFDSLTHLTPHELAAVAALARKSFTKPANMVQYIDAARQLYGDDPDTYRAVIEEFKKSSGARDSDPRDITMRHILPEDKRSYDRFYNSLSGAAASGSKMYEVLQTLGPEATSVLRQFAGDVQAMDNIYSALRSQGRWNEEQRKRVADYLMAHPNSLHGSYEQLRELIGRLKNDDGPHAGWTPMEHGMLKKMKRERTESGSVLLNRVRQNLQADGIEPGTKEYETALYFYHNKPVLAGLPYQETRQAYEALAKELAPNTPNPHNNEWLQRTDQYTGENLAAVALGYFDGQIPEELRAKFQSPQRLADALTTQKDLPSARLAAQLIMSHLDKLSPYDIQLLARGADADVPERTVPQTLAAGALAYSVKGADASLAELERNIQRIYRITPDQPEYGKLLTVLSRAPNALGAPPAALFGLDEVMHKEGLDSLAYANRINTNYAYLAKVAGVFGKAYPMWLQKFGGNLHDAAQLLPDFKSVRDVSGLGPFLLQSHGKIPLEHLRTIAATWGKLERDDRLLPPDQLYKQALITSYEDFFANNDVNHVDLALEYAKWHADNDDDEDGEEGDEDSEENDAYSYADVEDAYTKGLETPLPAWASATASSGGLIGRFLPREDIRGMFLGHYSNSCQHPHGAAASCAIHGQSSPNAAFFVVEDESGDIVAQSYVWQDADGHVVFDNVEAKGIGPKRMPHVQKIYEDVAKQMQGRLVNIGGGMNDIPISHLPKAPVVLKNQLGIYTDARSQRTLADNRLQAGAPPLLASRKFRGLRC